ncbi:hypothetical protein IFR05_005809 [Cadophora sp. M221]|nr:hypothetical protein IFR05_005809 [Cadophora sp. M221]
MMPLPRQEQQLVTAEKPVAAPLKKTTGLSSKKSALPPPKKPVLAVATSKKPATATPKKSSMATTKKGKTATPGVSKSNKKSTKKVTIAEKVEYEGKYEGYEGGYEEYYDEEYYEDWEGYEEYEYADYDEDDLVSEDSEGWNWPRPWLFPDPDGSKMVANFKRFHAINRDIAPDRLKRIINNNPYQVPYVIRPEAKCKALFEPFSRLKSKLRKLIWEFALPEESRVVAIYQHTGEYAGSDEPDTFAIQSYGKPPKILRVNRESRKVAKSFYTLAFNAVSGRPQYFNFRLDALHLWGVNTEFVEKLPYIKEDLAKVKNLAVHGAGLLSDADQYPRLRHFTSLKTLLVERPYEHIDPAIAITFRGKVENAIGRLFDDVIEDLHRDLVVKSKKLPELLNSVEHSSKQPFDDPMDVDKQVDQPAEEPSAPNKSSNTAEWLEAHSGTSGVVESMPEIDNLIDQEMAEMQDAGMLIDEDIEDLSSAGAVQVQATEAVDVPMIIEKTAKVDTAPVPVATSKEANPVKVVDAPMTLEQTTKGDIAPVPFSTSKGENSIGAADAPMTEISGEISAVSESPVIEIDPREVPVILRRAVIIDGVECTGEITILYRKAEDILEIVLNSTQWPERVNKEKKFWKWHKPLFRPKWINGSRLLNSWYLYMESARPAPLPIDQPVEPIPADEPVSSSGEPIQFDEPATSSNQAIAVDDAASSSSQSILADYETPLLFTRPPVPATAILVVPTPSDVKSGPVMGVFNLQAPEERLYVSPYPPTESAKAVPKYPAGFFAEQTTEYISPYLANGPSQVATKLQAGSVAPKPTKSVSPDPRKEPAKVIRKLPAGFAAKEKVPYISPYAQVSFARNNDEDLDVGDTGGITGGIAEGITGPATVATSGGGGVVGSFRVLRNAAGSFDEQTPVNSQGDTGGITGGIAEGITGPVTLGTHGGGLVGSFGGFNGLTGEAFGEEYSVDSDDDPMALDN